jgi:hypothetical protein
MVISLSYTTEYNMKELPATGKSLIDSSNMYLAFIQPLHKQMVYGFLAEGS